MHYNLSKYEEAIIYTLYRRNLEREREEQNAL